MKTIITIFSLLILVNINPQEKALVKDSNIEFDLFGIDDRVAGVHNAGNVGLWFENRGRLYPRFIYQGPSGEFPINNGKHYIYRINPMVGKPGNVIQSRYTINEEWEAVGGFHNPISYKIAFSDDPLTWHPVNGWPVKDQGGNPIFISDQDSYCVYSDSTNSISLLDLFIHQTGYVFANDSTEDIIFFKYEIINKSQNNYDSLYFSLYCDIDVGHIAGGVQEYADDRIGFDKENHFLYFFDDGFTPDWPDSTTGYYRIVFLETPPTTNLQSGITDFHYNLYEDDVDIDTVQFGIISSSEGLYNSNIGGKYFHPGNTGDIHFDDTSTVPLSGLDIVGNISSGPYNLSANQSLIFYTAIIGGEVYNDIHQNMVAAKNVFNSILTEVDEKFENNIPAGFTLSQNYPNPFNPSTKISWQSPVGSWQTLKIYDALGNEVATLVDGYKPAGKYEVEFNSSSGIRDLASGIYFYQLLVSALQSKDRRAENYIETKKMVLLK
jgi:hypothetical protein